MEDWTGMEQTFSTPNAVVDRLLPLLTPEETVVLLYAIRRTRGFQRQRAKITIRQFTGGNGIDRGTGLGPVAVTKALQALDENRVLMRIKGEVQNAGTEYQLQPDGDQVDWKALEKRRAGWDAAGKDRTSKARESRCYVPQNNPDPLLCPTEIPCYVPQNNVVMSDITTHIKTDRKPEENQDSVPSERSAEAAPVADAPSVTTRKTAKTQDEKPKDYRSQQALNIAVANVCARYRAKRAEAWPGHRAWVVQNTDKQAVRDAVKGIADADGTDYREAEREVAGYAEILAVQGTALSRMKFQLEDLRNGPKQHPSRAQQGGYSGSDGRGRTPRRDEKRAADGVAELDRILGEAGALG